MIFLEFLRNINIYYALTVGLIPMNSWATWEKDATYANYFNDNKVSYYAEYDAEVSTPKDIFFIGGGIKCVFKSEAGTSDNIPVRESYYLHTGLRYDRFEIGFKHMCVHPLAFHLNNAADDYAIYGGYEEIYVKVESRW